LGVGAHQGRDVTLLRVVMTERIGNRGFPCSRRMPRQAKNYPRELRSIHNHWVRKVSYRAARAGRAIDSSQLLFRPLAHLPMLTAID
jgi:hypothetical protein